MTISVYYFVIGSWILTDIIFETQNEGLPVNRVFQVLWSLSHLSELYFEV